MTVECNPFAKIITELTRIAELRENALTHAFTTFEARLPAIAGLLLVQLGSRQRATFWMSIPKRSLGGKSPYEVLAEGDDDSLWDLLDSNEHADWSP